ncbi:MAG: branched-chain amino acid ABC transporter permease [Deltaproteobacteria bacterium 13_1_40CM_4_68_19]|nr:MAG: branched-chain amino acid ABC transporter permease [Deltaproteobacteria bacterium 13_1_40CM_4_68_19]OLD33833.1 MAG: branched-chain amino acid ABC transporter permease [Myxococcales bacterium 13_1_40CM_2_68_15]
MRTFLPWAVAAVALALVPLWVQSPYALHIFILLFLAIALGESWNIIGGFAGQYSVGHSAWYGLGAYGAFILLQRKAIAPWFGVWVAIAAAVIIAVAVGWITFRLRGPYFVLASIAVAEIIRLAALNWKELTNGAEGILAADVPPLRLGGTVITDWNSKIPYFYMGLGMALFCIAVNFLVKRSKLGYYLQAIREDQDAAHSLGIPLTLSKNTGLAISAACTALAGGFAALYIGFIEPQGVFGIEVSIQMVLTCIIGGIGTVAGPVIGAVVVVLLSEALRASLSSAHLLVYGVLVIIVILTMPDGFVGFIAHRLRRKAAA